MFSGANRVSRESQENLPRQPRQQPAMDCARVGRPLVYWSSLGSLKFLGVLGPGHQPVAPVALGAPGHTIVDFPVNMCYNYYMKEKRDLQDLQDYARYLRINIEHQHDFLCEMKDKKLTDSQKLIRLERRFFLNRKEATAILDGRCS